MSNSRIYFSMYVFVIAFLVSLLLSCTTPQPLLTIPRDEPSISYLYKPPSPRVVLVLSSGSARGFAHVGVLNVLEKHHIPIDMIIGTSVGSIVGALYADHRSASKVTSILLKTPRSEVIDFSIANIFTGPITGNKLQKFILKNVRARSFEELKIRFIAIATDWKTGETHAFGSGPIAPAVNASSAIPLFFSPVKLYRRTYVDGGISDPVAVDIAQRFHPKIIIVVNLGYFIPIFIPKNLPDCFSRSINIMLMHMQNRDTPHADIMINPLPSEDIGMFDGSRRTMLMRIGERAAEKAIPSIRALLLKNHISVP